MQDLRGAASISNPITVFSKAIETYYMAVFVLTYIKMNKIY